MVHCCIIGCKSRSERKNENITFHSFPKKYSSFRQLWISATGRTNWEPTNYTRICSRHFKQNCFRKTLNKTYLIASSLPTLYVPELSTGISSGFTTIYVQEAKSSSSSISTLSASDTDTRLSEIREMEELSTTTEGMDMEDSRVHPIDKPSTSSEVMESNTSSGNKRTPIDKAKSTVNHKPAEVMSPREQRLVEQLKKQKLLAQSRRKKLAAVRSKCRRLEKKNAKLSAIIDNQDAADFLPAFSPNNSLSSGSSRYSPEV